jgi:hypothetical protein
MNYRALIGAAALVSTSLSPIFTTAAFADDDIILTPITNASDETPQEVCDDLLRPAAASGFMTEPVDPNDPGYVNVGNPYPDLSSPEGPASGFGTPVASGLVFNGSYYRNGGSPNVWGGANATLTFPQTQQLFDFKQDQTDTITFGCRVWKYEGPNNDILVQPPGLQTTGNVVVDHQTIDLGSQNYITNDPFVESGDLVIALICISPNNVTKSKPGTWTGKNGFNAANCPAASIAAGGTVPSDNAPDI